MLAWPVWSRLHVHAVKKNPNKTKIFHSPPMVCHLLKTSQSYNGYIFFYIRAQLLQKCLNEDVWKAMFQFENLQVLLKVEHEPINTGAMTCEWMWHVPFPTDDKCQMFMVNKNNANSMNEDLLIGCIVWKNNGRGSWQWLSISHKEMMKCKESIVQCIKFSTCQWYEW